MNFCSRIIIVLIKVGDIIRQPLRLSERKLYMLKLIKEYKLVSGEELSKKINISRTAVWKNIQGLNDLGYKINSVTGKGYYLEEIPDFLYPWELSINELDLSQIYYFDTVGSTNEYAGSLSPVALVLAEEQKKGQGRLSRDWISKSGGVYFSLVVKPLITFDKLAGLSLVVSVALAEVISKSYNLDAKIKWPNDIIVYGKKLSGILLEASGEVDELEKVVIGVGINVNQSISDFPEKLKGEVTSIREEFSCQVDRKKLVDIIIDEILRKIKSFEKDSEQVLDMWRSYSCILGKSVEVITAKGNVFVGKALDIEDSGALLVEFRGGKKEKITSGDVSLRLNNNRERGT